MRDLAESAIVQVSLDCIVAMDHRGLITEFNPAAERTFGYSRAQVLGEPLAELLIPPPLREAHRRGLARYLATGQGPVIGSRTEQTAMRADGSQFPVELAITRVPDSDPPEFVGFIRDLTEAKHAREEVRLAEERSRRFEAEAAAAAIRWRAEQRFRRLLDAAPDAMVIVERSGHIQVVNEQTEELFGWPRSELVGARIELLLPERFHAPSSAYFRDPTVQPMGSGLEVFGLRRDGSEFPLEMSLAPAHTDEGMIVIAAIRDVSDRKRSEARTRQTERRLLTEQSARRAAEEAVQLRDDFVAVAGHELKTPLAALLLQVESAVRALRSDQGADLGERLERALRSGERLQKLINELLDVSRITAGRLRLEPERFDLAELVREVACRFTESRERALISVRVEGAIEGVWDRLRIDQVFTNLLSNALKYGQGKPVDIEARCENGQAIVRVIDRGIGIDDEHQQRLFQRFERAVSAREFAGFGLGLWISRQIVEASRGVIEVASAPGQGSTFTVRLPLEDTAGAIASNRDCTPSPEV